MSTTPTAAAPAALSQAARIINTFIAPSSTFTDLKRSASWWLPFVLLAITSYGFVAVVAEKIGWDQVTEDQIRLSPKRAAQLEKLPPEQRAQSMATSVKITKGISYSFPLINLVWLAIIAAVLMATFNFGVGAEVAYKTSLAIVLYASLPLLLKTVLAIVALLAGMNPEGFTFQNPVATNPGYFLDPASSRFLYTVGTALDVFLIWVLALTAIGFSCVSKLKRSTTFAVVFGWYMVFTLLSAGLGAAFS